MGGDLNIPMILSEDTSSRHSTIPCSRKRIDQALYKAQLVDVWHILHPTERDYTFYSAPHKVYSCIDYFLVPHSQLHAVKASAIGSITWSDHAPISLSYALTDSLTSRTKYWRLNESLLHDKDVISEITRELQFYFSTKDTVDCNPGIVWEAHKAVIRGVLIKHGSKQRTQQLNSLLDDLRQLEARHKQSPSPTLETDLLIK